MSGADLSGASNGKSCATDNDCPSPYYRCAYPVADGCSAVGTCQAYSLPACGAMTELCGCNGKLVVSGCTYPEGAASGPTLGKPYSASSCGADGGQ